LRDVKAARRAALAHLSSHDAAAGPVAFGGVSCRCRAEEHAWHHTRVRCAGATVRAVSGDVSGLAWRLVEICAACAGVTARTTVIPTARKPASATLISAFASAEKAKAPGKDQKPPVTGASSETRPPAGKPGTPGLTASQAASARQLLSFVTAMPVDADARLLALVVAVRAAREGQANLTSLDVRRLTDPQASLDTLASGGWISGDINRIVTADPADATLIQAPGLTGLTDPPIGKTARSRVSGWFTRTLAAKPLKKASIAARLAALHLILHADPTTRTGTLPGATHQKDVAPSLSQEILDELDPGWIHREPDGRRYHLSEPAAAYLPAPEQQP